MARMKRKITQNDLLHLLPRKRLSLLRALGNLADECGVFLYLVGGVVRDLLLKRENWDLDLTVEGDGIAFARLIAERYRTGLVVFERFATARLAFRDGLKVDIATTRQESYAQPADLPAVQPASIEDDLSRRDFTINAMAVQLNPRQFGRVLDPYGGQHDLRARTIRVLHAGSFQDDPTRIFRAIRFEQRFNFRLERMTLRLLEKSASTNLIQQLSGPRLQNEILLLFAEHDPVHAIARLEQLKLLRFLHRRLRYTKKAEQVITALPKALAWWARRFPGCIIDRPIVYLMGLLSESSPAVVAGVIRRLALSRDQAKKVSGRGHRVEHALKRLFGTGTARPSQVYRLLADFPDEALVLLLARQQCSEHRLTRLKRHLVASVKSKSVKTALTGRDLQTMGLQPGPQYATILRKLLHARIDGKITTESEERTLAHRLLRKPLSSFENCERDKQDVRDRRDS
jgi:tRNA nucleotidyltransferase (CCA-adding enzyme)